MRQSGRSRPCQRIPVSHFNDMNSISRDLNQTLGKRRLGLVQFRAVVLGADGRPSNVIIASGSRGGHQGFGRSGPRGAAGRNDEPDRDVGQGFGRRPGPAPPIEPPAGTLNLDPDDLSTVGPLLHEVRAAIDELDTRDSTGPPNGTVFTRGPEPAMKITFVGSKHTKPDGDDTHCKTPATKAVCGPEAQTTSRAAAGS